jgi:hypothetical protein
VPDLFEDTWRFELVSIRIIENGHRLDVSLRHVVTLRLYSAKFVFEEIDFPFVTSVQELGDFIRENFHEFVFTETTMTIHIEGFRPHTPPNTPNESEDIPMELEETFTLTSRVRPHWVAEKLDIQGRCYGVIEHPPLSSQFDQF